MWIHEHLTAEAQGCGDGDDMWCLCVLHVTMWVGDAAEVSQVMRRFSFFLFTRMKFRMCPFLPGNNLVFLHLTRFISSPTGPTDHRLFYFDFCQIGLRHPMCLSLQPISPTLFSLHIWSLPSDLSCHSVPRALFRVIVFVHHYIFCCQSRTP